MIVFGDNSSSTLEAKATFKVPCDSDASILNPDSTGNSTVIGLSEPFYASLSPQLYALATATVISYILVILIFITPRTFYVGGPGGGSGFLSRTGLIGSHGSPTTVGVGRRPLLQKIATVTVAISLTIATSDTFNVASDQYHKGYTNANEIVEDVVNSVEIRIIRVISDTFLWLAQVQTLIRLFPRHKEKVTIKWLGFAMVSFDTIFSILDNFVSQHTRTRPRSFQDAIPALNYLFELSISLIYASCVVYYSLSKRRFAFWHPKMRNVCLVALVSYVSILIPVVFFVLDISLPRLAGWGEYIRWVGAAAASVVVWEWVERIESLERDERKDGILGREIFDGDEMLNVTPSEDAEWNGRGGGNSGNGDVEKGAAFNFKSTLATARAKIPLKRRRKRPAEQDLSVNAAAVAGAKAVNGGPNTVTIPQTTGTPPSRSDTTSASTVYAIRYHNLTSPSPGALERARDPHAQATAANVPKEGMDSSTESSPSLADKEGTHPKSENQPQTQSTAATRHFWQTVANPFKRRRAEPPAEVAGAQVASGMRRSPVDRAMNLKDRFGAFASARKDRFGTRNSSVQAAQLPVTVIPAPTADHRTWSPEHARHISVASDTRTDQDNANAADVEQQENESSAAGDGVVIIPVPTEGRTWSPPDAHDPKKSNSANSRRSNETPTSQRVTPPARTSTTPARNVSTPPAVKSTSPAPPQEGPALRRSTFTRPVSIPPISERLGVDAPTSSPPGSTSRMPAPPEVNSVGAGSSLQSIAPSQHTSTTASLEGPSPQERTSTPAAPDATLETSPPKDESQLREEPGQADQETTPVTVQDSAASEEPHMVGERSPGDGRDSGGTSYGRILEHLA